ncbi:MAG: hypothetical protein A2Y17_12270 [Clostridiales bacterium GWF2_38_85]|nr:MAG: hypothetical protein A2Y17_12270 [Clostridiales bacterium GWF2_38_85]
MFKKRMLEIQARKAEIRKTLETDTSADLDALEKELRTLDTEFADLERRTAIAAGLNSGTLDGNLLENPLNNPQARGVVFTRENVLASKEYRSAWAKTLMCLPLDETEQRALNTALTTTSSTYTAATADVNGVNNGGLFIPEEVNNALMQAISLVSPLFRDAAKTAVPGIIKFPYRKSGSGAKKPTEGTANGDGAIEWGELVLGNTEISETIRVTWKLEAMAVNDFIGYITSELVEQVQDTAVTDLIYGTGVNEMTGVTEDAIDGTYTGTALDGIGHALTLLPKKQKIGAKIYVAQNIVEEISFSKDATGNYIFTPINGMGVKSVATYSVEVDPYLDDGDFVIGNMGRYYRLNISEPLSVTKDISGKNRINDYTGYTIMGGAPQPNCFVYGTKG